ncbi:MAG: family 14 glycosylhydrolase [Clostridia bacterium]|nr:family 14 glycosylhydrolase [Clostridia bacterium]
MIFTLSANQPKPEGIELYTHRGVAYTGDAPLETVGVHTLAVEFVDAVAENASVAVNGRAAAPIAGWTMCNTGKTRLGAYLWEANETDLGKAPEVSVRGVPTLTSLWMVPGRDGDIIARAKETRVKPEEVKVPFELSRPMQLVSTVGDHSFDCYKDELPDTLDRMAELVPKMRSLGFNGIESYVRWDMVEEEKGVFDWSYYDAVINRGAEFGMKWFPLIIGGSAYALPEWYREGEPGFEGFVCLEHGIENNCPTIFNEQQTPYVEKYLHELGRHYNSWGDKVFGCRLGPSGNYGESQYPASGNWGYKRKKEHMHIGWWANDRMAHVKFAAAMEKKYGDIEKLNAAWGDSFGAFEEVKCFLPVMTDNRRKRKDFVDWYMDEMTDWCNRWAVWVREEMPDLDIYQSAGGWGYTECGTDFTDQTRGMVPVSGGIRATNEDESYELNFAITRMLSSAARFYGVKFGSEPAGFGTVRSVMNRLYNIIINNGSHLFYYYPNITDSELGSQRWLEHAPLLDQRSEPHIQVAALYPDTQSKLSDGCIRYLEGSSFFSQVCPLRRHLDYDFCSERMVADGALDRYKVLVLLGRNHEGDFIEKDTLEAIDAWVHRGGIVICPVLQSNNTRGPMTVEGDQTVYRRWASGDTGEGRVFLPNVMREPLEDYIDAIDEILRSLEDLSPLTKKMLTADHPRGVYLSALESGKICLYNDLLRPAKITFASGETVEMEPVSIRIV